MCLFKRYQYIIHKESHTIARVMIPGIRSSIIAFYDKPGGVQGEVHKVSKEVLICHWRPLTKIDEALHT